MKIGTHVSIAGGVFNAPGNAAAVFAETFQIFTRSPRGGNAPDLTEEVVMKFKAELKDHGYQNFYVHAPYYINLASENNRTYHGSIDILKKELARSDLLGAKAMMVHLGSGDRLSRDLAVKKVSDALVKILSGYTGMTQFLIEIAAGSGNVMGDTFDEVAAFIKNAEPKLKTKIGVCFDTAHAFASGYDLRTKKDLDKTLAVFDKVIGLKRLVVIHGNDSKVGLGERKDRHENIGYGKIGEAGFRALINHPKLKKLDLILETPKDDGWDPKNISLLKKMRKS